MRRKIDQYFKKGLNVPQEPPTDSWAYIQQHIAQKEKKRIFPFWLKISGIAALFLLMMGGGYIIERGFHKVENNQTVVKSSQNHKKSSKDNAAEVPLPETENAVISQPSHEPRYSNSLKSDLTANVKGYTGVVMPAEKNENKYNSDESSFNFQMNEFNPNDIQKSEQESIINEMQPEIAWELPVWDPTAIENLNTENSDEKEKQESLLALNDNSNQKEKSKSFKKKNTDFDQFYIAGFASPMALNTFVGNSMLADEMSQYKTENNITLAYGIKVGYAVSPTVKIRSGVSMIGFEQITKDVPLASNIQGRNLPAVDQINNVNYHGNLRIDNSLSASLSDNELNNKAGYGNIQQQSSYVEIPLETEIALFQTSSIGISATAGGSTWLLSKNKIYAHTDDYIEELGKASNLNNVSFSANAGLKFDLNLSESVKINLEPNFKYLINPVNDIKNYNPYTVGVNAGISVSLK